MHNKIDTRLNLLMAHKFFFVKNVHIKYISYSHMLQNMYSRLNIPRVVDIFTVPSESGTPVVLLMCSGNHGVFYPARNNAYRGAR